MKKNMKNRPGLKSQRSRLKQEIQKLTLYEIESALEKKVISSIRNRQDKIPGLKQDSLRYTAKWGDGDLTPGCKDCCLKGKWTQIRTTAKCNLDCSFCYYFGKKDFPLRELLPRDLFSIANIERFFSERDLKLLFKIQGKKFIKGVAWLFYEPLLEIDKILSIMSFIHKEGYHQWLYTNGVYATEENLKRLKKAGLDEIRFNLAATNCSDQVIKNMKTARRYFKYLCIESPMFTGFYNSFIKKRKKILATGVDHMNFAELQLFPNTMARFKKEGEIYRYKMGYISPIKSRELTYDIFEIAAKEKWKNVVLHDCSNETKFYRGVVRTLAFGDISYSGVTPLDKAFYKETVLRSDLR
jgi:pyruvate formate-lyase activating enzyme-like uncharacterized protein